MEDPTIIAGKVATHTMDADAPLAEQATACLHPRRLQQPPRPLSLPGESILGDLAEKLEKNGLAEEGKWSRRLLESSGMKTHRRLTEENGGTSAL
ncbi:hypothetical protein ACLB2K_024975 [Fragaria x ananassa]